MIPVRKSPKDYAVYRISPGDSNRLAIIFDTATADESLTVCVEIFDPYGKTHIPQLIAEKKIVHLYYFFLRRFIVDFNNFIKNPV